MLPQHCDWGCKRDSKGKRKMWRGYKLHVGCADGDIPLAAFLSSANLHDSKAMIPMMQKVSENFDYFYDLADAGYDAAEIRQALIDMQHVPIIDRNPRRGEKNVDDKGGRTIGIVDATTRRYFVRPGIERVFSHLHESHGGKFVRVRGNKKVFLHLMFGLIVVTAEQIFSAAILTQLPPPGNGLETTGDGKGSRIACESLVPYRTNDQKIGKHCVDGLARRHQADGRAVNAEVLQLPLSSIVARSFPASSHVRPIFFRMNCCKAIPVSSCFVEPEQSWHTPCFKYSLCHDCLNSTICGSRFIRTFQTIISHLISAPGTAMVRGA